MSWGRSKKCSNEIRAVLLEGELKPRKEEEAGCRGGVSLAAIFGAARKDTALLLHLAALLIVHDHVRRRFTHFKSGIHFLNL
jgi:hypothetical protein